MRPRAKAKGTGSGFRKGSEFGKSSSIKSAGHLVEGLP